MRCKEFVINGAMYKVYENGDVYGKQGKISQRPDTSGYASFTAGKKGRRTRVSTHRLVASAFVSNPNGYPEVDHKDADRMNPSAGNLEWVEHIENVHRAKERGSYAGRIAGTKNPKAKLNEDIVCMLRDEYAAGHTIRELHKKYNIAESTIGNVVHRHTWANVI